MKKIISIIALVLCTLAVSAQTNHMKFKGIPMEGTLQNFTNKLKLKGYTPMGIKDGVSLLNGEFAGYKDCQIYAIADKSGMICKVAVIFPKMDRWSELESCYNKYKSMLTEKYGAPESCTEIFQNDYIDDDNRRMHELKMDRCKYITDFVCDEGDIKLEISHESFTCFVILSYFDKVNQDKLRKKIMDDL